MKRRLVFVFATALVAFVQTSAASATPLPAGWRAAGRAWPWEQSTTSLSDPDVQVNSVNGNTLAAVPVVGWSARGGQPCGLLLWHNSQGTGSGIFGAKWRSNLDVELRVDSATGDRLMIQGDGLGVRFTRDIDGGWSAPPGVDLALANTTAGFVAVGPDRVRWAFGRFSDGIERCIAFEDRNGNRVRVLRDALGNPTSVVDPSGRTLVLEYAAGKVVGVVDPIGSRWSLTYDMNGDLVRLENPWVDGVRPTRTWTYDAHHNPVVSIDECGAIRTRTWDTLDRLTSEKDPLGNVVRHGYADGVRSVTDPLGATTTYSYDTRGRLVRAVDPLGYATHHTWTDQDRLASTTDPLGRTTRFSHDARGRCAGWVLPDGRRVQVERDAQGDPVGLTLPSGRKWWIPRDARGNQVGSVDPAGNATTTLLDAFGLPIGEMSPTGAASVARHDIHGNPVAWTGPAGNTESVEWDLLGRPTRQVDAAGLETLVRYDRGGRVSQVVAPGGRTTAYTWDPAGRLIAWIDATGAQRRLRRDNAGRVVAEIDPLGAETRFRYDAAGRCIEVIDPVGRSTAISWNARGERVAIRFPDATVESFSWTPNGLPERRTDARGISSFLRYDAADRPIGIRYSDATPAVDWAWDVDDRPAAMRDGTGTTRWTWDDADRCVARSNAAGSVSWTFAPDGTMRSMRTPGLGDVAIRGDAAGRPLQWTLPDGRTVRFTLDRAGRRVRTDFPDGTASTKEYDPTTGDLVRVRWIAASGSPIDEIATRYDAAGRRIAESRSTGGTRAWEYDGAGRLSVESWTVAGESHTDRFLRDPSGVVTGRSRDGWMDARSIDANGRPVRTLERDVVWDAAGNAIRVVDRASGTVRDLAWDAESRLVEVRGTGGFRWVRDGDGVPVARGDGGGLRWQVRAGDGIASPVVTENGVSTLGDEYGPLLRIDGGRAMGIATDPLGSVRRIGEQSLDSTAYGEAIPGHANGFGVGWGYEPDATTGWVRVGHRVLDPTLGVFLSRDPALADHNPYAYADGDPVNAIDPDGLEVLVFVPKGPNVPTRGGGRTRGRLILIGDNGRWIREWPANSGGSRAPGSSVRPGDPTRLPRGDYDVDNPRRRRTKGMVRDDVGFSIDIEPRFPSNRRYLRIHPDGGGPGTQGCIGIFAPAKDLEDFYRIVRGLIRADRLSLVAQ